MVFGLEQPEIQFLNCAFSHVTFVRGRVHIKRVGMFIPRLGDQHVRNLRRNCLQYYYSRKVLRHSEALGLQLV